MVSIKKKINSYKQLDYTLFEIIKEEKDMLSAENIKTKLKNDYELVKIGASTSSISMRLLGKPNIKTEKRGRRNYYGYFQR